MEPKPNIGGELERFHEALLNALVELGITLTDRQRELMFQHYRLLVEANQRFNLTRITSPEDAAIKHYADSLSVLTLPDLRQQEELDVLDIGTGAGFPAVPLAIAHPNWHIEAVDGTGKKARFVADCARTLGLTNVTAVHARAETMQRNGSFDLVVMRAVMDAAKGISVAAPLVIEFGLLILYKTAHLSEQELRAAEHAARRHDLKVLPPVQMTLSHGEERYERLLLRYEQHE